MCLREGHELFCENQSADNAFAVLSGQIDLYHQARKERSVVRSVTAGEMIGAFALVAGIKRPAHAVVTKRCEVLRINRSLFSRILNEHPQSKTMLYKHLSDNFCEMMEKLRQRHLSSLEEKPPHRAE